MQQVSLKIKSYAGHINGRVHIVNNNNLERRILYGMLFSLGILIIFYVCLLTSTVINIAERKTLEANVRTLSDQVSGLELNYLALSNGVNQNLGISMGFKEAPTEYATRKGLGFATTPNAEVNDIASRSL